jgi:hypothetical protein
MSIPALARKNSERIRKHKWRFKRDRQFGRPARFNCDRRDGSFSLAYEDGEFRIRNEGEKRPDVLLLVFLPRNGRASS